MRTKTTILSAVAIAAGILSSQAQSNVYSVNIVGYINSPLKGGVVASYTMVNNPLDNKVSNTYSNLFGTLPVNSQVVKWNGASFDISSRVAFGAGWTPTGAQTNTVVPGQGVFVRLPAGSAGFTNTFIGELTPGSYTNVVLAGYKLVGSAVPIAGTATELGITAAIPAAPAGSQVLKWDPNTQAYLTFNRVGFGAGWTPSLPSVGVGEGFFIRNQSGGTINWSQTYTNQ